MMKVLAKQIKNYMDNLAENNYFNGAVLVGNKTEILLNESYGWSSFQYKIPNVVTTKFRIGSLTKAFTAMAILKLHEQGRLNIDETILKIFPEYPCWEAITIHHLLSNRSGIPNFTSFPDYWVKTMRLPNDIYKILDSIKDLPLEFGPGEDMSYSNSGYLLLTAIIEKVSGVSYAKYLQESILDPLDLKNTGVDNGRTIVESLATGHTVWEKAIHTDFIDMSFPQGAYGMYSTIEDLYNWVQTLKKSGLVNQDLQSRMFTGDIYGYGWFVNKLQNLVNHFGDVNGFVSNIVHYFKHDITVIVLSNINITPVEQIGNDLASMVLGKPLREGSKFSPLIKPIHPEKFIGIYTDGRTEISIDFHQDVFATIPKMYGVPYKFKLIPVSATPEQVVYKSDFINDKYTFNIDTHSFELVDSYGELSKYKKRLENITP